MKRKDIERKKRTSKREKERQPKREEIKTEKRTERNNPPKPKKPNVRSVTVIFQPLPTAAAAC